jgi:hypothetical protein
MHTTQTLRENREGRGLGGDRRGPGEESTMRRGELLMLQDPEVARHNLVF